MKKTTEILQEVNKVMIGKTRSRKSYDGDFS